jgi:hypothetical protein
VVTASGDTAVWRFECMLGSAAEYLGGSIRHDQRTKGAMSGGASPVAAKLRNVSTRRRELSMRRWKRVIVKWPPMARDG